MQENNEQNNVQNKDNNIIVDKTSEKYKIALKFVNKMLENMGRAQIEDLTEFKNVDRNDVLTESNTKILESIENEIWEYHEKVKCGAYHKSGNRTLNVLRGLIRENGMKLCYAKREITEKTGVNKGFRRTHYIYHIE